MPGTLDFSVVIVSWNVRQLLQECLESIFRLPQSEQPRKVFVVDNASTDGTGAMVREKFPQVSLIANTENRGFAAANNQALKEVYSGDVLLLNPDTVVHPGAFPRMLQAFADHPKAGIVGPKLLNADGTVQPSVRRLPTMLALAAIALKLRHWWPSFPPLRRYLATDIDAAKEQVVGQVMGAAFLIRRSVISAIGVLDEGFHVWFEEVDYCKRAADAGWETWYVPAATITHVGGQSFAQQASVAKQRHWHQSVMCYSRKHFSRLSRVLLWKCGWIGIGLTWAVTFLQKHAVARLAAIPVLLALLTGLVSSSVGLLSDDWDWYYEGRLTQQDITRPLTHNVGGAFYRPLATYSYALDYAVAPYNVAIARTQQAVLFAVTAALLVVFVWQLTHKAWLATMGGVFFSLWPQHHEVTTWLGSRPDLLSLLWMLAGFVTFVAALRRNRPALYVLTVLWAGMAVLSKETGILILPGLFLVTIIFRRLRDWRAWATLVGSAIVVAFYLYVRSVVLGQLIGGYGDGQTQVGLADFGKLGLSLGEGWLNWAWLSAQFSAAAVRVVRYVAVAGLGVGVLVTLAWHWRAYRKQWRTFGWLCLWFGLAVSISLPVLQSVNPLTLNGMRYLYLASSVLAVGLAWFLSVLRPRKKVAVLVAVLLAALWLVNLQPWREASAENANILAQVQRAVPNPPLSTVMTVRGLPGDTYGAVQWYARRSLPEALVAAYGRPDLYAPAALEESPYCKQQPAGQVVAFAYARATQQVTLLGTQAVAGFHGPAGPGSASLALASNAAGTFTGTADANVWGRYRGLVVTLEATEDGFIPLQLKGEGSVLYTRTVVRVQPGRNDVYFSVCNLRAWVGNVPKHSVTVIAPIGDRVTALHLVAPYAS